jgi:hypothetical protein
MLSFRELPSAGTTAVPCTQVIETIKSSCWTYEIGSGTILPKPTNGTKSKGRRRLGRQLTAIRNRGEGIVFTDFAAVPQRERNFLRMLFLDPSVRGRYMDWASIARICVGYVRAAADGEGEARLAELIGELSLRDPDFRTWWAERHASYQTHGTKTFIHPTTGQYPLDWQILRTADEHQTLMVMTAPADSHSLQILRQLDSHADTPRVIRHSSVGLAEPRFTAVPSPTTRHRLRSQRPCSVRCHEHAAPQSLQVAARGYRQVSG